ncbi:MAG: serine/threonine protein kinase [Planctomycetes bacterium]|nr:serine/threonine protein kinase [Planctomycetota bacterium]
MRQRVPLRQRESWHPENVRRGAGRTCPSTLSLETLTSPHEGSSSPTRRVPAEVMEKVQDPEYQFKDFILVEELGTGGLGSVWKAWEVPQGRWVSLKILHPGGFPDSDDSFEKEISMGARLVHPGIVRHLGSGVDSGTRYLVKQYVEGAALAGVRLPIREALETVVDVAEALNYAHSQGILHLDVKPDNILRDICGHVFLTDFGLAMEISVAASKGVAESVLGTPFYLSPEQAMGDMARVGPASDIYSLGITLYEFLAGRSPFEGDRVSQVLRQIVSEPPPPLSTWFPGIPEEIERVVSKAIDKEIRRRYRSAGEFAGAIKAYLRRTAPPPFPAMRTA